MLVDLLIYNPIMWVMYVVLGGAFLSWLYWYCKTNFELQGSWKNLDKSMHWKSK